MKKRNLFMSCTLMCGLLFFAFTFGDTGIRWLWTDNKPIAIILGIFTVTLGLFWFKQAKKKKIESQK